MTYYRNSYFLAVCIALCLWSDGVLSFSVQPSSKKMRTPCASTLLETHSLVGEEGPMLAAATSNERSATGTGRIKEREQVDLALVGSLACLATLGMLVGVTLNGNLIESIEDTGNGSAATFIVDCIFGAVAVIVSVVSRNEDV
jgi:hypothetical protein